MSIPLVQNNEKDAINTSIIAIKRQIERINQLLGLSDSGSSSDPDLSGLATKQELQDAVNSLQPVDEVTLNNMQSVTSNAVSKAISYSTTEKKTGGRWIDGKPIYQKVVQEASFTSSSPLSVAIADLDFLIDVSMKRNYDVSHSTWWTFGAGTTTTNNLVVRQNADSISIEPQSSGQTIKNFSAIIEYTKTTD